MVWGWTKNYDRRTCTYNYKDLKESLPITLSTTLPIAYTYKTLPQILSVVYDWTQGKFTRSSSSLTMKIYQSSHRSIPIGVKALLEADYKAYLDKKKQNDN